VTSPLPGRPRLRYRDNGPDPRPGVPGLTQGRAADPVAKFTKGRLLGQSPTAAIEMTGTGGTFYR